MHFYKLNPTPFFNIILSNNGGLLPVTPFFFLEEDPFPLPFMLLKNINLVLLGS